MVQFARELRKNMTKEERHLWYDFLRQYEPRFLRQRPVEGYVLDFYCAKARLAVELDGSQHYQEAGERHDQLRDSRLGQRGIQVLRFSNLDVNRNFQGVCEKIHWEVARRLAEREKGG